MIERVANGDTVLDPQFVNPLVKRRRLIERHRENNPLHQLTPHEARVLTLMAEGFNNAAIATQLRTNDGTVEKAITAIRRKLGLTGVDNANTRVQAVLAYLRYTGQLRRDTE
jgi:DNA-binding NarL/FixJ family response regulator